MQITINTQVLKTNNLPSITSFLEKFIRLKENENLAFASGKSSFSIFPFFDYYTEADEDPSKLTYFMKTFVPITAEFIFSRNSDFKVVKLHKTITDKKLPEVPYNYLSEKNVAAIFGNSFRAVSPDDPNSGWRPWREDNFVVILSSTDRVFQVHEDVIPEEED